MEKVVDRFVIYMKLVGLNDNKVTVAAGLSNGIYPRTRFKWIRLLDDIWCCY